MHGRPDATRLPNGTLRAEKPISTVLSSWKVQAGFTFLPHAAPLIGVVRSVLCSTCYHSPAVISFGPGVHLHYCRRARSWTAGGQLKDLLGVWCHFSNLQFVLDIQSKIKFEEPEAPTSLCTWDDFIKKYEVWDIVGKNRNRFFFYLSLLHKEKSSF